MAATNALIYWKASNYNSSTKTVLDHFDTVSLVGTGNIYTATTDTGEVTLRLSSDTTTLKATLVGTQLLTNSFSIEFSMNMNNYKYNGGQLFTCSNNTINIKFVSNNGSAGQTSIPEIEFRTVQVGTGDTLTFRLNNLYRESLGYMQDGQRHHFVFTFDSTTGIKKLYVDGQCPPGFSGQTNSTTALSPSGGDHSFVINNATSYRKNLIDLNHFAIYNTVISDRQIYQHYLHILSGGSYSFTENASLPVVQNTTGSYNSYDFAPGTNLTTLNVNGITQGVSVDQLVQMRTFPNPRYKSGNTLVRLFNWFGLDYLPSSGGSSIPGMNTTTTTFLKDFLTELFTSWNYLIPVVKYFQQTSYAVLSNPTSNYGGMMAKLANDNPSIPTQLITIRAQLSPVTYVKTTTFTAQHYLQNSSGQFLSSTGGIAATTSQKVWRPISATFGTYRQDGESVKNYLNPLLSYLSGRTTPRINYINENGEVIAAYGDTTLNKDPGVVSEKNSSGLDMTNYFGRTYKQLMRDNYGDIFVTATTLSGTVFTEYGVNGTTDPSGDPYFRKKWAQARLIHTPINGKYYSTGDFYPRFPNNWRNWSTAFNGLQHFIQAKFEEISTGDNLMSPFVSAGWDKDERRNIRPAQYLGLLKVLGAMGSEFFYPGFFNEAAPFPDPKNYIWQLAIPSYAQAITSRYETLLRNSELLNGDYPRGYDPPQTNGPGYNFYTGDLRKFVVVRKHTTEDKFIIAASLNPVNNYSGGVEDNSVCTIYLDGINPFKFNVRRQGSVYYYKSGGTPVFYQLDEWHDNKHPYYWTQDFIINAPLYDNNASVEIKTEKTGGTGIYTAFTSFISFSSSTNVDYLVSPRTAGNHYIWVSARSKDGTSTGFNIYGNEASGRTITCIKNTSFAWFRKESTGTTGIVYSLSAGTNKITITSTNDKLEIDKIHISRDSSAIYSEGTSGVSAIPPIVVSSGGTVVLSAATGSSYYWFPFGQTTQQITATTSGVYYAWVGDGTGCTATTNSITVVVSSDEFLVNANALGPTTFSTGGNVVLSASTLYYLNTPTSFNYSWYSAATALDAYVLASNTPIITAVTTGYYFATATSTATTRTLSSFTIFVNSNAAVSTGRTTESIITNPLIYNDIDRTFPWSSTTYTLLDGTVQSYYVFVKIKSRTGQKTGLKISMNNGRDFIGLVNCDNTTFSWYRVGVFHAGLRMPLDDYFSEATISFQANNNALVLDSYVISRYPTFVPGPFPNKTF